MKKTFAFFAITLLFLSAIVLATENPLATSTQYSFDRKTMSKQDTSCGPIQFVELQKDKAIIRVNGNRYEIPRPEALLNENQFTILEKEKCIVKVIKEGTVQNSMDLSKSTLGLSVIPFSGNEIFFSGAVHKLEKGYPAQDILGHKIECSQTNARDMLIKVDSVPYLVSFGKKLKKGDIEVTALANQGGNYKYGNSICVVNVAKTLDSIDADTPASTGTAAQGFAQKYISKNAQLFGGKVTGKVTYSPEEQARLEAKLTESTEDKLVDDQRQLELDKVGGKFGGDITGKVVTQVDTTKRATMKKFTADPNNGKKLLSPTIKSTKAKTPSAISGQFNPTLISGKATSTKPEDVTKKLTPTTFVKPKQITATGYSNVNTKKVVPGTKTVGGKFGGKITGKAVTETEPAVEKGFFAKLLSSIFGI